MSPPRLDPRARRRAIMLLEHSNRKLQDAESGHRAAIKFARECGASLQDIAAASGLRKKDLKRLNRLHY